MRIPKAGKLPKLYDAEAHAKAVQEYEARLEAEAAQAAFEDPALASTGEPDLDEAISLEIKKTRRGRQSADG